MMLKYQDYSRGSRWAQCNYKSFIRVEERESEDHRVRTGLPADGERGPWAWKMGGL